MIEITLEQEIVEAVKKLDKDSQRRVLIYARALSTRPSGEPGEQFIERTRELGFTKLDLAEIEDAIKDCERIDWDGWDFPR